MAMTVTEGGVKLLVDESTDLGELNEINEANRGDWGLCG
jgi:hypothetical protein